MATITEVCFKCYNSQEIIMKPSDNSNIDDYNQPLVLNFTAKKEIRNTNDKVYFNPFICKNITKNPFKSNKRDYPIDFRYKKREKVFVTLILPNGFSLSSSPKSNKSATSDNEVIYNFMAQSAGNVVQAVAEFKVQKTVIKTSNYLDLKNIFDQVISSQSEYFVLTKNE